MPPAMVVIVEPHVAGAHQHHLHVLGRAPLIVELAAGDRHRSEVRGGLDAVGHRLV
jgi:hypothetical protein